MFLTFQISLHHFSATSPPPINGVKISDFPYGGEVWRTEKIYNSDILVEMYRVVNLLFNFYACRGCRG